MPTRSEKPLPELPLRKAFLETIKAQLAAELQARERENHIDWFYPDTGPLRRELYPKHLEFFGAGAVHRERCMLAANRVGKTEGVGGYETVLHLTGEYPNSTCATAQSVQVWVASSRLHRTTTRFHAREIRTAPPFLWCPP